MQISLRRRVVDECAGMDVDSLLYDYVTLPVGHAGADMQTPLVASLIRMMSTAIYACR